MFSRSCPLGKAYHYCIDLKALRNKVQVFNMILKFQVNDVSGLSIIVIIYPENLSLHRSVLDMLQHLPAANA